MNTEIKIALTGHTKGLGENLYNNLIKTHTVKGFSRSNGYDIKNPVDRQRIVSESLAMDVFINLVHNYYHQTDLLVALHKAWQGQDSLIINVSSGVVQDDEWAINDYDMMEYKLQKINLETTAKYLNKINAFPRLQTYTISELDIGHDTKKIMDLINEEIRKK
jgi:hypothetical protein